MTGELLLDNEIYLNRFRVVSLHSATLTVNHREKKRSRWMVLVFKTKKYYKALPCLHLTSVYIHSPNHLQKHQFTAHKGCIFKPLSTLQRQFSTLTSGMPFTSGYRPIRLAGREFERILEISTAGIDNKVFFCCLSSLGLSEV